MSGIVQSLERLKLFNEKASNLRHSRFVEQVFRKEHGFTWITPGDGSMSTEWRGADEEATKALALDLRYFIQRRDEIHLEQIQALYEKLPLDIEDKQRIKELVESLESTLDSTAVVIKGSPVTRRRLLEVFMYGGLAHATQRAVYKDWTKNDSVATWLRYDFEKLVKAIIYVVCQVRLINERAIMTLESA